jgi:hypothetical protein
MVAQGKAGTRPALRPHVEDAAAELTDIAAALGGLEQLSEQRRILSVLHFVSPCARDHIRDRIAARRARRAGHAIEGTLTQHDENINHFNGDGNSEGTDESQLASRRPRTTENTCGVFNPVISELFTVSPNSSIVPRLPFVTNNVSLRLVGRDCQRDAKDREFASTRDASRG